MMPLNLVVFLMRKWEFHASCITPFTHFLSFDCQVWVVSCYPAMWCLWSVQNVKCSFFSPTEYRNLVMKTRGLQKQVHHVGQCRSRWHFERVSAYRNDCGVLQRAVKSNGFHITERHAALASTADHQVRKTDDMQLLSFL